MTYDKIPSQLTAIHTALAEKIGEQPFLEPYLTCHQNGKWIIGLYRAYHGGDYDLGKAVGSAPDECIANAFAFIDRLPDPDTAAKQDWQRKLGDVIDEGHALNLPDEVMTPLHTGSQAMTENLLAAPEVSQ